MDRHPDADASVVLVAVQKRLSERLRQVCAGIPAAEFDALVRRMAAIELKYAKREEQEIWNMDAEGHPHVGRPDGA